MIFRLKAVARWLHGSVLERQNKPYKPDFRQSSFYASLNRSTRSRDASMLQDAVKAYRSNRPDAARLYLARHFRERSNPKFFVDIQRIGELAHNIGGPVHVDWKRRTLNRVDELIERALPIYETSGPPLGPYFDWRKLPGGPGGDVLYSVRPHRFAFAPRLALAVLHGDSRKALVLTRVISNWMSVAASGRDALPYLSNLVVIHRFLSLSWAWAFMAARSEEDVDDGFALETEILQLMYADAQFLVTRIGKSYPNNHLLADAFAGWYVGMLFPEFFNKSFDYKEFEGLWLGELERQVYVDGTSFEHSTHYQEFACEMAVAYVLLSRRNGDDVPRSVLDRLEQMLRFQVDLCGPEVSPPAIGDGTEDPLLPLDDGEACGSAAWIELYRALFKPEWSPAPAQDPAIERAYWLLGGDLASPSASPPSDHGFRAYEDGGVFVLSGSDRATRLLFRTGPAPDRELIGGHMHADLLSVYASVGGVPFIVDAGTYTYRQAANGEGHDSSAWRKYFMGPAAHNGLVIDGEDPLGPVSGDFRDRDVSPRVTATQHGVHSTAIWVEGEVIGECAYRGHRRGVVQITDEYWIVYDVRHKSIPAERVSFRYQCADNVRVIRDGRSFTEVGAEEQRLLILASRGLERPEVVWGQRNPPGGWVSSRYGRLTPAPQISFGADGTSPVTAFALRPGKHQPHDSSLELHDEAAGWLGVRVCFGDVTDHLLLRLSLPARSIELWGIRFDGLFLWLRTLNNVPSDLRCLGLVSLSSRRLSIKLKTREVVDALEIRATSHGYDLNHCQPGRVSIVWPARPSPNRSG